MIKLTFSKQELNDISEALDNPDVNEKFKRKLLALRMHHLNVANQVIASTLNISTDTVTNYIKQYLQGGLSEILEDKSYRPISSLKPFIDCLKCIFKMRPPSNCKEAISIIEKQTGIKLSEERVRNILKELGLSYRRTAQIPGKSDPQLQLDFYTKQLEPKLQEASQGIGKVFFVDAAHFVLGCFLGMVWSFSRLFVKGASGRQRYNVLGAVDSHSKELISVRTTDYINANSVADLMKAIREKYPQEKIRLVMDNAKYQRCNFVEEYASLMNIEILFLPSYSPNLNLIERLWKMVKSTCLKNRYFQTFETFRGAIDAFLDNINDTHQRELESCLSLTFQFFPIPKS